MTDRDTSQWLPSDPESVLARIDPDQEPAEPERRGPEDRLNVLVLADRCWSHPQGGGTGANLYAQVKRWAEAGHRITVIAGDYPGAERVEQVAPNLTVHRMGGRGTVFPRGVWAVLRGLGRDADVVLEIINGITFLTPLWLRKPRVALVCHPHRELYVGEFGRFRGRLLAALLEELPLRLLYRRAPFLTISESARDDLVEIDGIPREHISVAYCGVEPGFFGRSERTLEPRLLYLGRLKAYKRIDHVLDVLEEVPGATLDIVGDGDHREAVEAEIERRGLGARVQMHGHVDDETRGKMYGRAWILLTASSSEGWGLTVIEAALCGTPSAALAVGGLRESIVDGETGVLADDMKELIRRVRELTADRDQLERLGEAARQRALTFTWERTAAANLRVLRSQFALRAPAARIVAHSGEDCQTVD
jgi:glycosyltransferase involved in cell wall biosynthesis